ncbi:hypothetical protein NIES208_15430 [[Limnothrix rosea] IAM M-220]|nr:hypothetical protein NIES208_15430 [[Limnothrix rosea] IAM M-220]
MTMAIAQELENYSRNHPEEVLLVTTINDAEVEDQVMIFKGFSSSLMQPTDFNPDNPIFAADAKFVSLDRLQSPYNPSEPTYLEQNMSWAAMQQLLAES